MSKFWIAVGVVALVLTGCPPAKLNTTPATQPYEAPSTASIIPITSEMGPTERILIAELNTCRDIRWSTPRSLRNELLLALAVLKSPASVVLIKTEVESE